MPGTIGDRLRCLAAIASCDPDVRGVSAGSALKSCLTWYGPQRIGIHRRMKVSPLDHRFMWVQSDGYGVAWPRAAPVSLLLRALIEIRVKGNPHFYFDGATRVRPGDVVLDIGACEGAFAAECLAHYGAAQVFCFEPDPVMADALRLTARLNGWAEKMSVVEAAVSDRSGSGSFVQNSMDPLSAHVLDGPALDLEPAGSRVNVTLLSLDEWGTRTSLGRMDFVKIDAEGADLAVLQGARECLTRWQPDIAATTYHRPGHSREMMAYLSSLGLGYLIRLRGVNVFDSRPRPMMLLAHSRGGHRGS